MKTILGLIAAVRAAIKAVPGAITLARLHLVDYRLTLLHDRRQRIVGDLYLSADGDTDQLLNALFQAEAAMQKAHQEEMRLSLKLYGLREMEIEPAKQPRPNLRLVKP